MGLARKGSRSITVEGRAFRWVLSPDSGFMVLVAELREIPGQRLEAQLPYLTKTSGESRAVTPEIVRAAIGLALHEGWRPQKRGLPPFRLKEAERAFHSYRQTPNTSLERTREG
jgi:hypothetical protein